MVKVILTKEGVKKLREELKFLKEVKRKEIGRKISEAKDFGDITENSEYENAKEEQAFLEGKIVDIGRMIQNSQIVEKSRSCKKVSLGCEVKVRSDHKEQRYYIVGTNEVDPIQGKISVDSPIGNALIDKSVGDVVTVKTPAGQQQFRVVNIA